MRSSQKGFTLIELLVIVAIIGLLSSVVLAALNAARFKAIDTTNVALFRQIQNALELYRTSNTGYPGANSHHYSDQCNATAGLDWTDVFNASFPYMTVPADNIAGCMIYSKVPGTNWRCYPHESDNSNPIVPGDYHYMLVFPVIPGSSLSYTDYPRFNNSNYQRCMFGPPR